MKKLLVSTAALLLISCGKSPEGKNGVKLSGVSEAKFKEHAQVLLLGEKFGDEIRLGEVAVGNVLLFEIGGQKSTPIYETKKRKLKVRTWCGLNRTPPCYDKCTGYYRKRIGNKQEGINFLSASERRGRFFVRVGENTFPVRSIISHNPKGMTMEFHLKEGMFGGEREEAYLQVKQDAAKPIRVEVFKHQCGERYNGEVRTQNSAAVRAYELDAYLYK